MRTRTQTVNRLHVLLTQLLPGGAPRQLTADTAGLLRPVRPRAAGQVTPRRLPADLIAEIRRLDRCVTAVTAEISAEVAASATTLTSLRRTGDPGPEILARVGDVTRFLSAPTFASYTAPPQQSLLQRRHTAPAASGHRSATELLPAHHGHQPRPTRQPRHALLPAQTSTGKGNKESLRCPKRGLSDVVSRQRVRDLRNQLATDPGGQIGAAQLSAQPA